MQSVPLPRAVPLSPLQQWRNFSQPRIMHAWLREHVGPLAPIRNQGLNHVLVLTPEGARQVFSADPAGYDPYFKEGFTGVAGPASLWVLSGEAHRRERQLFAPAVRANHFSRHGNTIREITRLHTGKWRAGQTVRAIDTTLAIARDVIMELVFGVDEPELMDQGRAILDELRGASNPLPIFVVKLQQPWFPPWRRYSKAKASFTDWVNRLLVARRLRGSETDDVVGCLLAACQQGGHQTTAGALAWALYELGRHPGVLAKLRAELDGAGAGADPGLTVKLPYLGAVCDEAVRLHPVLAECPRVPTGPLEILGHIIPAGTGLVISITAIHHDPALYPEPDQFIPERFIERSYSSSEFLPFGGAHRRCLGAALAEYEIRISLAEIVLAWEFEPAAVEHDVRHDVAMGPQKGVPLRIMAQRSPIRS